MSSGSWAALDGCHSVGGPRCLSYPELVVPQSPLPCSEMGHAFRDSLSSHMSHCISRRKDISCGVPVQTFFFFFFLRHTALAGLELLLMYIRLASGSETHLPLPVTLHPAQCPPGKQLEKCFPLGPSSAPSLVKPLEPFP